MKWMPDWIHRILYDAEPLIEVKFETVEPAKEPEPEPVKEPELVVGEPVRSLATSITTTDDWIMEWVIDEQKWHLSTYVLKHKGEDLTVSFCRNHSFTGKPSLFRCTAEWMTKDEREFMSQVFLGYLDTANEKKRLREERIKAEKDAADRERFMVLVTK